MSTVLEELTKYKERRLEVDGDAVNNEADNLILKAIEEIQCCQKALLFYADANKYYYAKKDHPNTRLAEDGGEIARETLPDYAEYFKIKGF